MKKVFVFLAGILLFTSCEKDPDMSELDSDFTVYTQYDEAANFASASTYYLPDSILTTGSGMKAVYWKDDNAQSLLAQVASEMALRGYVRTEEKAEADLGLQLTYVESTTQVSGYEQKTDKKGNLYVNFNVSGVGISARVDITLPRNSQNASVTILPNFNSNRLTLDGHILPLHLSNIYKGTAL